MEEVRHGYPYFPILIDDREYGLTRDESYEKLQKHNVFGRRYFYPLISQFPTYRGLIPSQPDNIPNAIKIAEQVICLPIYPSLGLNNVVDICKLIFEN